MKLFSTVLIIGGASAAPAMPPGYEDQIWCPSTDCKTYTNPYGWTGASSSFYKCYNPTTDETTDGVWTGSLTNVVPPGDFTEPEMCTASEYSQCDTDDDCSLEIAPSSCNCYVSSSFHPFDPCDGLDPSDCNTSECTAEECDKDTARCIPGHNGQGGTCEIDRIYSDNGRLDDAGDITPGHPPANTIPAACDSDDQCRARIRSRAPFPAIGVGLCGCYAASSIDRFDECEGQVRCRVARCSYVACDGLEAYCNVAPNDNDMGDCALRPTPGRNEVFQVD